MKRFLLVVAAALTSWTAAADEGMWLPSLIGRQIKDMRAKGLRLSAEDIYSVNRASLKDAIVLFNGGCTGEFVSAEGLLFTNHHCGIDQVQRHSSVEHDYLTNGYWAMSREEELPCEGLWVRRLVRMEDVTSRVEAGEKTADIARAVEEPYKGSVEAMYYGNQWFLFVYEEFNDVRLVGAPPASIGKFGGDTDNWMWPRHTGDFSVFRVYADKNNGATTYSPQNQPYKPKKWLKISTEGIKDGEFTFIYGFPGTTREYVASDFIDYTLNYSNPVKIGLRTIRLDIINEAMRSDAAVRIQYLAKAATIANAWKKWQGESWGLARRGTLERRRQYEARLNSPLTQQLHELYAQLLPYAMARDYYVEGFSAIELTQAAVRVIRRETPSEEFYRNYSPAIDRAITRRLLSEYVAGVATVFANWYYMVDRQTPANQFIPKALAEGVKRCGSVEKYVDWLFDNTALLTYDGASGATQTDPMVELVLSFMAMYRTDIAPTYNELNRQITELYTPYMRAQMAFEPKRAFYPDANLTLRVAYGHVEGYNGEDGISYGFQTTLDGIIEKDNPAIYDYDIPQRVRDLYAAKDYGRWGTRINGRYTVPVAFIATNHTTGGNSGSPVMNARGELVGINFDRTWLSTMSDLEFDPTICRNIAVDIRYVLFCIDRVGGAGYLLDELGIKN